ncbi:MAG: TonB family protein [bacterium]
MATFTLPAARLPGLALKSLLALGLHGAMLYWTLHAMPGLAVLPQTVPKPIQVALIVEPISVPIAAPVTPPRPLPNTAPAVQPVVRHARATAKPLPHSTPKSAPIPAPVTLLASTSSAAAMATTMAPAALAAPVAAVAVATPAPPTLEPARFNAGYLNNPAPNYPLFSRRNREQGTVLLSVRVSAQGKAEQVQVKRSSGFVRLDAAAVEVVREWRFVPAQRGPEAVAASVVVPMVFRLDS